ncbi:hypothetical protein BGZ98_006505 [Dissophora globulifera]|nr:hypothetical protein BGZ98_006505 [Dissophora globulifera]
MDYTSFCLAHPSAGFAPGLRSIRHPNNTIDESLAFDRMRQYYGGDIGIQSFMKSTEAYDENTKARIHLYQLQD